MLMITTTMGMLYWIHGNTSHLGPAVSLVLVLVVRASGLEKRLVKSSTSSNKSHHGSTVPIKVCVCVCVCRFGVKKKKVDTYQGTDFLDPEGIRRDVILVSSL